MQKRFKHQHISGVLGGIWLFIGVSLSMAAGPRLVCDEAVYRFGNRIGSEEIVHEFRVFNRGDEPSVISNIKFCCGVTGSLSSMEIAPGSNAVCRAVFDTKRRTGFQEKQILISSNDRRHPYFELKLEGTLLEAITIDPKLIRVKSLYADGLWETFVTATNQTDKTITLQSASCNIAGLKAEVVEAHDRSWKIRVFSEGGLSIGRLRGKVELAFSTGREVVNMMGDVEPVLQTIPEELRFSGRSDQPTERLVLLKSRDGRSFSLTETQLKGIEGTVKAEQLGEGKWRLTVRALPGTLKPGAALLIQTDCRAQPERTVNITQ